MKRWVAWILLLSCVCSGCGKTAPAETVAARAEETENSLYGTWQCVVDDSTVILRDGGVCAFRYGGADGSGSFSADGEYVYTPLGKMEAGTYRDVPCLILRDHYSLQGKEMVFVREEDYPRFAPERMPITLENWADYFAIGNVRVLADTGMDEKVAVYVLGIYLKEEYRERLGILEESVIFTVKRDVYRCDVTDPLGEKPVFSNKILSKQGYETRCKLTDWQNTAEIIPENESMGTMFALVNSGFAIWDNHVYIETDAVVTAVEGSLLLYPAMEE